MNQFTIKERGNHGRKAGSDRGEAPKGGTRKRESPREKDPRKEKAKWGTTHDKRIVRN